MEQNLSKYKVETNRKNSFSPNFFCKRILTFNQIKSILFKKTQLLKYVLSYNLYESPESAIFEKHIYTQIDIIVYKIHTSNTVKK